MPRRLIVASVAASLLAVIAAVAFSIRLVEVVRADDAPPQPPVTPGPTYQITGQVRLASNEFTAAGADCTSTRPDVRAGLRVMVVDGTGATIAGAELGPGRMVNGRCNLPFNLALPVGAGTYGIDLIGYGQLRYSEAELQDLEAVTIG